MVRLKLIGNPFQKNVLSESGLMIGVAVGEECDAELRRG